MSCKWPCELFQGVSLRSREPELFRTPDPRDTPYAFFGGYAIMILSRWQRGAGDAWRGSAKKTWKRWATEKNG